MVEQLMKGAMVLVVKGKTVVPVSPLPLTELAKPPVKVAVGLVERLIPEFCLDRGLLANQFYLN